MITVKEAISKSELTDFVKFPMKLYRDNPYFVPPLINDELAAFDKKNNPAFDHAEAQFYLAYRGKEIVGRLAAIVNWQEVNEQKKSKVRFGWFDVIDDIEVTKALLQKVYELGRKHQLAMVEGPIGFSNLDKVGALTFGYDELGTAVTWYNAPYYITHLEQLGFQTEKEYIESTFLVKDVDPEPLYRGEELVKKRYGVYSKNFDRTADIMPYVDQMFDLFNESYKNLASFVAVSERQKEFFKKKYISFINPEYIKFVFNSQNQMIAFAIVMPGYAQALQKANGKLFPFGIFHLLKARKSSKDAVFYLIGIAPEYQNKGVTALIMSEFYRTVIKKGVERCIRTPELAENQAIHLLWRNFNPKVTARRKTFSILLENLKT
ncbi:GTP cyclohydrolase [Flavobacterium aurantiibacter]|uniref:GTP cyclohydrolase n=1 Tax=Flavobacterium aurantiibacter TaxID=2023067 RepID=A0A255ZPF4_9FLAO|nr:GTP cyclohydrolase [Flavobacterium aurantiibacter]OYQ42765.1 GTP cyclohydrolase [Flavobacterium aurantiibacter]